MLGATGQTLKLKQILFQGGLLVELLFEVGQSSECLVEFSHSLLEGHFLVRNRRGAGHGIGLRGGGAHVVFGDHFQHRSELLEQRVLFQKGGKLLSAVGDIAFRLSEFGSLGIAIERLVLFASLLGRLLHVLHFGAVRNDVVLQLLNLGLPVGSFGSNRFETVGERVLLDADQPLLGPGFIRPRYLASIGHAGTDGNHVIGLEVELPEIHRERLGHLLRTEPRRLNGDDLEGLPFGESLHVQFQGRDAQVVDGVDRHLNDFIRLGRTLFVGVRVINRRRLIGTQVEAANRLLWIVEAELIHGMDHERTRLIGPEGNRGRLLVRAHNTRLDRPHHPTGELAREVGRYHQRGRSFGDHGSLRSIRSGLHSSPAVGLHSRLQIEPYQIEVLDRLVQGQLHRDLAVFKRDDLQHRSGVLLGGETAIGGGLDIDIQRRDRRAVLNADRVVAGLGSRSGYRVPEPLLHSGE